MIPIIDEYIEGEFIFNGLHGLNESEVVLTFEMLKDSDRTRKYSRYKIPLNGPKRTKRPSHRIRSTRLEKSAGKWIFLAILLHFFLFQP